MANDQNDGTEQERRLGQILSAYYEAVKEDRPTSRDELLRLHPDLAEELADYFAGEEHFDRLTEPLRNRGYSPSGDRAEPVANRPREEEPAVAPLPDSPPGTWPLKMLKGTSTSPRPSSFGDYELLDRIGEGGMGVVYEARRRGSDRRVALKMIGAGRLASDEDVKRFHNEAEAAAELDHPHIVPIYEVGKHDGYDYFSMKLIDGSSLARRLKEYQSAPKRAAQVIATVARAIHHAHQRGVLHRDLKPSNILLDTQGEPFVSDFGLAKRVKSMDELTRPDAMPGTPRFMAPEQASGTAVTTATDIHGLGAVLYALLTGRPPFQGNSVPEILEKVRNQEPPPPCSLNRAVDRDLQTICLKCLDKDPKKRYRSAEDVAEDLERWLAGKPIAARPVGRVVKGWRWARRNKAVAGLLGLVGVLLIAGMIGLAVSNAMLALKNAEIIRQRNRAQQVVDDMYTQVAERLLPNVPGMEPVRRELLIKALRYYEEEAVERNGADVATRVEMANASFRVGRIHHLLSEIDLEVPAFLRAGSLLEQLAKDFPNEPNHRLLLARSLNELGIAYWTNGRGPEAAEAYRRGLETAEQAAAAFPERSEFREVMAKNLHNLAVVQHEAGRLAEAETNYRGAIRLREKLAAESPAHSAYRHELALGLGAFAKLLGDIPPPGSEEAGQAFQQALDIEDKLVAEFPSNAGYRASAADLRNNLGGFLTIRGHHRDAEAVLRQALLDREKLAAQNPNLNGPPGSSRSRDAEPGGIAPRPGEIR